MTDASTRIRRRLKRGFRELKQTIAPITHAAPVVTHRAAAAATTDGCACAKWVSCRPVTRVEFAGTGGVLVGDSFGAEAGPPVLLLHGGGQTRHSWRNTARTFASAGFHAVALDQRGHGDSAWVDSGDYQLRSFADDVIAVSRVLGRPAVVGASLGGLAALMAEGESDSELLSALVLVDIAPRMDPVGVTRIVSFMMSTSEDGFASLDEAADAIAMFLPHRTRPTDLSGLSKNLRRADDGRFRWHWDPRFMRRDRPDDPGFARERLAAAARNLSIPTMLVRGQLSDVLSEEAAREFLDLVPHAHFTDVAAARHMIAGDRNDRFTAATVEFLRKRGPGGSIDSDTAVSMPMSESVYKVIELVGVSTESWEKAASAAIARASKSLKNLRIAEVSELDMKIEDGNVVGYRAKVKVSFKFED